MQNVRFDLLRLRSAGVAAVLGDITQATHQPKALSRDVDNAIAPAGGPKVVNVTFNISQGPKIAIRDVEFIGNRAIGDAAMRDS